MDKDSYQFQIDKEVAQEIREEANTLLRTAMNENAPMDERVEATGLYLECIAALAEAGEKPNTQEASLDESMIEKSIQDMDTDDLLRVTDEMLELMDNALTDPFDDETLSLLSVHIEQAGLNRQGFFYRLLGAKLISGKEYSPSQEIQDALDYFEATVRSMAWALSPANDKRESHTLMIAPGKRSHQWWWSEALDVNWEAIRSASEVAQLLERYPSFGRYFESLRKGARLYDGRLSDEDVSGFELPETIDERQEPAHTIRLAAASGIAQGQHREIQVETKGLTVHLIRTPKGYHLLLMADSSPRVKSPRLRMEDSSVLYPASKAVGWDFDLGKDLPQKVTLDLELDGEHLEKDLVIGDN